MLCLKSLLARKASVVRQHHAFTEAFGQRKRDALAHASRADKHQRRPIGTDQLREAIVGLAPHLVAGNRTEFIARHFYRDRHLTAASDVDHLRGRTQELRDVFQRTYGCRKPDPLRLLAAGCLDDTVETRERQSEMCAALVICHRVNLIDDYRRDVGEQRTRLLRREHNEERLRRRDEHVRRLLQHPLPFRSGCIAGSHRRADLCKRHALLLRESHELAERDLEILANVVRERLERRDVHDQRLVGKSVCCGTAHEVIQTQRKSGKRFSRAGGRRD